MASGKSLEGKTALVTGAAKRLGRSVALALAENGANVLLHYNGSDREMSLTAEIARAMGVRVWPIRADFSLPDGADTLFKAAAAAAGRMDILVNNASIFPTDRLDGAIWEGLAENLKVNAWAPMALTRAFAAQGHQGAVVNLLDARIHDYDSEHLSYHLSKRMLHSLTRMAALEYAPKVRVNAVAPGLILPPAGEDISYLDALADTNPLQRIGREEDVVNSVIFLLTNPFITGQTIYVDGGRHMKGNIYGG